MAGTVCHGAGVAELSMTHHKRGLSSPTRHAVGQGRSRVPDFGLNQAETQEEMT